MIFNRFIMAMQFLTILPIPYRADWSKTAIADISAMFPLVGLMLGLLMASCASALSQIFGIALTNALLMLILVISYGGLHLDGLADTFDGLATRGDKERKLQSMKDSAVGPMGVIAIAFTLGIRWIALNDLASTSWPVYTSALLLMPTLSRWVMVASMYHGTPARANGLGRSFMDGIGMRHLILATLFMLAAIALPSMIFTELRVTGWIVGLVIAMISAYALSLLSARFCRASFGGHTGDTVGATGEISEIIFLLVVLTWQRLSIL